ncbi:hypothetical protein KM043_000099, partial [Ampulex compressa]
RNLAGRSKAGGCIADAFVDDRALESSDKALIESTEIAGKARVERREEGGTESCVRKPFLGGSEREATVLEKLVDEDEEAPDSRFPAALESRGNRYDDPETTDPTSNAARCSTRSSMGEFEKNKITDPKRSVLFSTNADGIFGSSISPSAGIPGIDGEVREGESG